MKLYNICIAKQQELMKQLIDYINQVVGEAKDHTIMFEREDPYIKIDDHTIIGIKDSMLIGVLGRTLFSIHTLSSYDLFRILALVEKYTD